MPKIIELRQDRNLICNNFDGYKLSLDSIPLLSKELSVAPYRAERSDNDQYSLLHAELFSLQNQLFVDVWDRNSAYFLDRSGKLMKSFFNEQTGCPESLEVVYNLEDSGRNPMSDRKKGDYNFSMRFISEKFCVLCDGKNQLYLFDTKDRRKANVWSLVTKDSIANDGDQIDECNYMIYDSRLDVINEQKQISLALGRVQRIDDPANDKSHHEMHLVWARWVLGEKWELHIMETLEGKGSLYYCAFEPRAESLVLSSNHSFEFRSNKRTTDFHLIDNCKSATPQLHDQTKEISGFTWSQADDDLVIKFNVRPDKGTTDYNVQCTSDRICVKCADETLLDHELFSKIDKDLTTWTVENDFLQVTLMKQVASLMWPHLLADGAGPRESTGNGEASSIPMEQKPIVNLEAPIEDCDFPMGIDEDEIKIERFHLPSKSVSHSVLLGHHPPLFSTNLRPGYPHAIVTRQDTDACVWLQHYNPNKPNEWTLRHEGNLHAFAYVQASKTQKKFMDCAPDLSFSVICESFRHVFLYRANVDTTSLRNRKGNQIRIGKQHLVTLSDTGEILGVAVSNCVVQLLTEKCLMYLQLNE